MVSVTNFTLTIASYTFKPKDEDELRHCVEECILNIRRWMRENHRKLNDLKTEFIIIGYHTEFHCPNENEGIKIRDNIIKASLSVRNIWCHLS